MAQKVNNLPPVQETGVPSLRPEGPVSSIQKAGIAQFVTSGKFFWNVL